MKFGIFTDIHANLPALKKALEFFENEKCDRIIHIGDLIGIGPYPRESIEFALANKKLEFLMGNHDYWYAYGLPNPIPAWMSKEEVQHQKWTHNQIGEEYKSEIQKWPWSVSIELPGSLSVNFRHYGLNKNKDWFKPIVKDPGPGDLDKLFEGIESDIVFFGHHHIESDITGTSRYINPGSAGCYDRPEVRVVLLKVKKNLKVELSKHLIGYSDNGMLEEFDKRKVPARDFIREVFFIRQ